MKTIRNLRDAGISIVSITHYMEEAAQADRILVTVSYTHLNRRPHCCGSPPPDGY